MGEWGAQARLGGVHKVPSEEAAGDGAQVQPVATMAQVKSLMVKQEVQTVALESEGTAVVAAATSARSVAQPPSPPRATMAGEAGGHASAGRMLRLPLPTLSPRVMWHSLLAQ